MTTTEFLRAPARRCVPAQLPAAPNLAVMLSARLMVEIATAGAVVAALASTGSLGIQLVRWRREARRR